MQICALDHAFTCRRRTLGQGPPAPLKLPIAIQASVGAGGRNNRSDVVQVQGGLNDVDAANAGPSPKLSVDGLIGPKTLGAIGKFQRARLGFADNRVDPGGPTLGALNAARGAGNAIPIGSSARQQSVGVGEPDPIVDTVLKKVATTRGALLLAQKRIESVVPFVTPAGLVTPSGPGSERARFNLELVDECFRLSEFVNPSGSFQMLRFMFDNMLQELRRCRPELGAVDNGLFLRNPVLDQELVASAWVIPSGKFSPSPTIDIDGVAVIPRRIYLCASMALAIGRNDVLSTIAHELAHLVSAPGNHVGDTLRGHSTTNQRPFQTQNYRRIENAENYAWFTWRSFEGPFAF